MSKTVEKIQLWMWGPVCAMLLWFGNEKLKSIEKVIESNAKASAANREAILKMEYSRREYLPPSNK